MTWLKAMQDATEAINRLSKDHDRMVNDCRIMLSILRSRESDFEKQIQCRSVLVRLEQDRIIDGSYRSE